MADAAGRFQNVAALETEPLRGLIHGLDDDRRGVMSVKGGGAGGSVFLVGQDFGKLDLFLAPVRAVHVKHLWHRTPADVFDQQSLFVRCSRTILGIQRPQDFNRLDVLLELLFETALTQTVGIGDAVVVMIPERIIVVVVRLAADC